MSEDLQWSSPRDASSREEAARTAKREAFAMCEGCPLTMNQVLTFVARYVELELYEYDRPAFALPPAKPLDESMEAFIAKHPHWTDEIKAEWRATVAQNSSYGLVRNRGKLAGLY